MRNRAVTAKCLMVALAMAGGTAVLAQNAAQRAALAQLARAHSRANLYPSSKPANHARPLNSPSNGVEAINAPLELPHGLAFDTAGNLYIADTDDDVIREINLEGIISTVAGNGAQGYGGDGGSATLAMLDSPTGVAIDSNGNIYIADSHNNRIREVSGGTIATIAGTGTAGYSGEGTAATALLNLPTALAVDSNNNLYIADTNNHRIREISGPTISPTINTVAGNGTQGWGGDGGSATSPTAQLDSPTGVAVDSAFNIYIGDTHNQRVRMVNFGTGFISTIAGTGIKGFNTGTTAATAELARPRGLAVDGSGTVFLADSDNNLIRTISGAGLTTITTIAGNGSEGFSGYGGSPTSASLDTPDAVALSESSTLFSDTQNDLIGLIEGTFVNAAGGETPGVESLAISGPTSVVYGSGTLTATFSNGVNTGTGLVSFNDIAYSNPVGTPQSFSANTASVSTSSLSLGAHYIVASYPGDGSNGAVNSGVYVLPVTTTPSITLGTIPSPANNGTPTSITANFSTTVSGPTPTQPMNFYAIPTGGTGTTLLGSATLGNYDSSSYTYTATLTTSRLPAGMQTITATYPGDSIYLPATTLLAQGITVIANMLWIGNPNPDPSNTTSVFSPTGTAYLSSAISNGGTGVAIDQSGNVWSLNSGSSTVAEFDSAGGVTSTGHISGVSAAGTGLAIDGSNQVWVTNADGSISVFNSGGIAISPSTGYTDGLSSPTSIAVDISGNVWIANHGGNSVTKVLGAAAPTVPLATEVANIAPASKR